MAIVLNTQGSCASDTRGTGLGDCVKQYGDLLGIDAYNKGWSLNTATDTLPTEAEYKALIQEGVLYPLNNLYNFEQQTPDNEFATGSTGKKSEIRAGKPEYTITWDEGGCFHKGLFSLRGKNRWDMAFKFETGVLFASNVAETSLKAFDNGMFSVATMKFQQGTDPEMSMATFQFNSAVELNSRSVFYTWDDLGYDMNSVSGVVNANVEFNTTPIAGTSLEVAVLDDCNRSVEILGLTDANNWVVGGVQASATVVDSVVYNAGGYYVLTLDVALISTDTIEISLGDVALGYTSAESTSGDLYKGNTSTETIA